MSKRSSRIPATCPGEREQDVDREAHIGRKHDGRAFAGVPDRPFLSGIEPGRADDVRRGRRARHRRVPRRRVGQRELDHDAGALEHPGRIVADGNAERAEAGARAGILAERGMPGIVRGRDEDAPLGPGYFADHRRPHAAGRPDHADFQIRHRSTRMFRSAGPQHTKPDPAAGGRPGRVRSCGTCRAKPRWRSRFPLPPHRPARRRPPPPARVRSGARNRPPDP